MAAAVLRILHPICCLSERIITAILRLCFAVFCAKKRHLTLLLLIVSPSSVLMSVNSVGKYLRINISTISDWVNLVALAANLKASRVAVVCFVMLPVIVIMYL